MCINPNELHMKMPLGILSLNGDDNPCSITCAADTVVEEESVDSQGRPKVSHVNASKGKKAKKSSMKKDAISISRMGSRVTRHYIDMRRDPYDVTLQEQLDLYLRVSQLPRVAADERRSLNSTQGFRSFPVTPAKSQAATPNTANSVGVLMKSTSAGLGSGSLSSQGRRYSGSSLGTSRKASVSGSMVTAPGTAIDVEAGGVSGISRARTPTDIVAAKTSSVEEEELEREAMDAFFEADFSANNSSKNISAYSSVSPSKSPSKNASRAPTADGAMRMPSPSRLGLTSPIRTSSRLSQRRIEAARICQLDGKFVTSTTRPATGSALMVAQRVPQAALKGTEDEFSLSRAIASQGKAHERYEKFANQRDHRGQPRIKPNVDDFGRPARTPLGVYLPNLEAETSSRRQLFNRVVDPHVSDTGSIIRMDKSLTTTSTAGDDTSKSVIGIQSPKQRINIEEDLKMDEKYNAKKIEMLDGKRARFVSEHLIPPSKPITNEQRADAMREKFATYRKKAAKFNELMDSMDDNDPNDFSEGVDSKATSKMEPRRASQIGLQARDTSTLQILKSHNAMQTAKREKTMNGNAQGPRQSLFGAEGKNKDGDDSSVDSKYMHGMIMKRSDGEIKYGYCRMYQQKTLHDDPWKNIGPRFVYPPEASKI
jgi:hypothetical protein